AGKKVPAKVEAAPDTYTVPITVSGKALDQDGKPIAGAQIYLASQRPGYQRLAETTSSDDGTYKFENIPLPIKRGDTNRDQSYGAVEVCGTAKGFALAWRPAKAFYPDRKRVDDVVSDAVDLPLGFGTEDPIELDLKFTSPQSFRGRIVDDHGMPLA